MAIESQGTTIEIGTGDGTPVSITGVTLGAVTKVTATAHGLSVGDVVTFASITGTTELNGQTAMVTAVEGDDDFWVNIDSSSYTDYTSDGTATPNDYTIVGEIVDWDGPSGEAAVIDTTHLTSTRREKLMGLPDEGQITFSVNFQPDDAGQQAVRAARNDRQVRNWRLTYSDATVQTFEGFALGFSTSGGVDGKVDGNITVEISGEVTTA